MLDRKLHDGQATIFLALAMTVLMTFVAFAADLTPAYMKSVELNEDLELAKDDCMRSLNYLKFTDDPAHETAETVIRGLQQNGFTGDVDITYYEEPFDRSGRDDRLVVVKVETATQHKTSFAAVAGIDTIPISSSIVWTSNPYSSTEVWTPADVKNAKMSYSVASDSYTMTGEQVITSSSSLPSDMVDALDGLKR